jgi:hypothetical protein
MQKFMRNLWSDESGQDATEYVLLVILIADHGRYDGSRHWHQWRVR